MKILAFHNLSNYLMAYLPLLTVLVAIVGWSVIIRNTKSIASRQETHALVVQILTALDGIDKAGRVFWSAQAYPAISEQAIAFESEITEGIENVRELVGMMALRKLHVNVTHDFRTIRSSLTLDAQNASAMTAADRVMKANSASRAARDLKRATYLFFLEQYKPVT